MTRPSIILVVLGALVPFSSDAQSIKPLAADQTPIEVFTLLNGIRMWSVDATDLGGSFVVYFNSYDGPQKTEMAKFRVTLEEGEVLRVGLIDKDEDLGCIATWSGQSVARLSKQERFRPQVAAQADVRVRAKSGGSKPDGIPEDAVVLRHREYRDADKNTLGTWVIALEFSEE